MLFDVCGCNKGESIKVLKECLRRIQSCKTFPKGILKEPNVDAVKKWAHYVRTHPDKVWSKQQNILINSMIQNAKNVKLTPKQYLRIKGELKQS